MSIAADEAERAALALRFGVVSIARLEASFTLRRVGEGAGARGRVVASLVQACSATGDPLPAEIDETVDLRFVPPVAVEDEIELSDDGLDTIEFEGGTIDLGEAASETMALAIDPFVRGPRAEAELKAAGVIGEDEVTNAAFSGLAALKARLESKD